MVRYELTDGVATITIDDPERMNPMSNAVMAALVDAVDRAAADPDVRVVVLTGAGDRAFSAGGDLRGGFVDRPLADHAARGALVELIRRMRRCPKPIVARVNGHALGGGFGLLAAADLAVAVRGAKLGTPEIGVGLWPMIITAVLQPLAPQRPLLEMMLVGRTFDADEAQALGIVNRAVDREELDAVVGEYVDRLSSLSPAILALGKRAFYAAADLDLDTALDHLHHGLTAVATTEDAAEGIAAFGEGRAPRWRGR